jgi:hypothetical protein
MSDGITERFLGRKGGTPGEGDFVIGGTSVSPEKDENVETEVIVFVRNVRGGIIGESCSNSIY